jgi:hypothetical protein
MHVCMYVFIYIPDEFAGLLCICMHTCMYVHEYMYACIHIYATAGKAHDGRAVGASRIGQLHALPSAHELQELDEIKVEGLGLKV